MAFVLLTGLFFGLFYRQTAGVNVLLYEMALVLVLELLDVRQGSRKRYFILLTAVLISGFFTAFYGSDIAIAINVLSMFLLTAYRAAPQITSPWNALRSGALQLINTSTDTLKALAFPKGRIPSYWPALKYRLRLVVLPVLVVLVFLAMYMVANSRFNHLVESTLSMVSDVFSRLFVHFSWQSTGVLLCGLFIAAAFLFQKPISRILGIDASGSDKLIRRRVAGKHFAMTDLKKEYQTMLVLLVLLNVLILVPNLIDLDWVWLHYKWDGGELKEFVHEGTYLLILAILLSCAIALYIFRNNLNHFNANKRLKQLTYIWIGQNIWMALSVGMRTWRYIEHFNLAHLRIGLLYFLLAAIVFMVFVMLKIRGGKSDFYLIRNATASTLLIAFMLCPFDWDRFIVRYNFNHAHSGFLHKDWTMTLSDKTLPIIGSNLDIMTGTIDSNSWHNGKATDYHTLYQMRVQDFLDAYSQKHWLSLSFADILAYKQLKGHAHP